jgi:polyisoprenoid-binding protein YceI
MTMKQSLIAAALLAAVGAAQAEMATYAIDPSHTFVHFEADHFGVSTLRGRFDKKTGTVRLDKAARTGSADITIDVNSLSTGVPPLDAHLKSKDFFNAAKVGSARFSASEFSFDGDKVNAVAGTLTLLGKTQPVTLKATHFNCVMNDYLKREVCGGDFETTVARSQFGMSFGVDAGLPDHIRLLIQIEAIKQ